MARIPMSRNDLYHMEEQIGQLKQNQQVLALLLKPRIELFFDRAGHELTVTRARFNAILDKYVQTDDRGMRLMDSEGEQTKYRFITDPHRLALLNIPDVSLVEERFNQECSNLMQQQIFLEW
jgi:hypothetical protein